ncbi:hypothetical protein L917_01532 [Phytophthora nicotianae]|uniref:Uncharacterized protein n=1 Tax=Phytophthora nicotianae TaxID=4792 RepID=W2LZ92_PHYNI|nr:hypothetical protein L917_01532 [Phytophthora nicotianae]
MGPAQVIEEAGYDNYLVKREDVEDEGERMIVQVSFMVSYNYLTRFLEAAAADLKLELKQEDNAGIGEDETTTAEATGATTVTVYMAAAPRGTKRRRGAMASEKQHRE